MQLANVFVLKSVYGDVDSRQEITECLPDEILRDSKCVVSLWDIFNIMPVGNDNTKRQLITKSFTRSLTHYCIRENNEYITESDEMYLSDDVKYYEQQTGAFGTGFLAYHPINKKKYIFTATHNLNDRNLTGVRFVFGFTKETVKDHTVTVPKDNIFEGQSCRRVDKWTMIELEREVDEKWIAAELCNKVVTKRQRVHMIGHGCGLSMKLSSGSQVVQDSDSTLFLSNLDSFCGNSGSPIFDSETHKVVGMMSGGKVDYIKNPDDKVVSLQLSYKDWNEKGEGETCIRVSTIVEWIQSNLKVLWTVDKSKLCAKEIKEMSSQAHAFDKRRHSLSQNLEKDAFAEFVNEWSGYFARYMQLQHDLPPDDLPPDGQQKFIADLRSKINSLFAKVRKIDRFVDSHLHRLRDESTNQLPTSTC